MSNTFYNVTGKPTAFAAGRSFDIRTEFGAIQAAFDLLPNALGAGQKGFNGGTWASPTLTSPTITGSGAATFTTATLTGLKFDDNPSNVAAAASTFSVFHSSADNALEFCYGTSARILNLDIAGNVYLGDGTNALGTTATDGFFYLPRCAGVPTGAATGVGSGCAAVVDTSSGSGRLYIRIGSTWSYVALT